MAESTTHANNLFSLVDTDGNGSLDITEFRRLHKHIVENTRKEVHMEHQQRAKAVRANRRLVVVAFVLFFALGFLAISTAANAVLVYTIVDRTVGG